MWKLILATTFTASCHGAMMNDLDAMRGYVEDTRLETTRHLQAARAATTMTDIRVEMASHADGMGSMVADIDVTMADMTSHCGGAGMDDMRGMHADLDLEIGQHGATMNAVGDLPAAMTEIERHAAAMMTMMDGMSTAMTRMSCW